MILLANGLVKVSRDASDYPIHKAIFDGTLEEVVELSFTDKATLTSLKLFGIEVDPMGNTPLKLAVRIGDYDAVRILLKSGCAEPNLKPTLFWPLPNNATNHNLSTSSTTPSSQTFNYSAYELACLIGDEETLKHFIEDEHRVKRHSWKQNLPQLVETLA